MMLARQLRSFQSNKEAGQKRPGRLRVLESRASAPKLHQKHSTQKQKPLPDKPPLGLTGRGFYETDVFGASPVASAWIGALGATPARRAIPYHAGYKINLGQQDFGASCKFVLADYYPRQVKQQWNVRMHAKRRKPGGAVGRPSS